MISHKNEYSPHRWIEVNVHKRIKRVPFSYSSSISLLWSHFGILFLNGRKDAKLATKQLLSNVIWALHNNTINNFCIFIVISIILAFLFFTKYFYLRETYWSIQNKTIVLINFTTCLKYVSSLLNCKDKNKNKY